MDICALLFFFEKLKIFKKNLRKLNCSYDKGPLYMTEYISIQTGNATSSGKSSRP